MPDTEVVEAEIVENNKLLSLEEFSVLKNNYDNLKDIVNLVRGLLNNTVMNYLTNLKKIRKMKSQLTDEINYFYAWQFK